MTRLLSLLLYNLLRFEVLTQRLVAKPFIWIFRLKKVKESYARSGVNDPEKTVMDALLDPDKSISVMIAEVHIKILAFLLVLGTVNYVSGGIRTIVWNRLSFVLMGVFTYFCMYLILFRGDKHLKHYKTFKKASPITKKRWVWFTFFFVVSVWLFVISSFAFVIHRMNS